MEEIEYKTMFATADFTDITIEHTRIYHLDDMLYLLKQEHIHDYGFATLANGKFMDTFYLHTPPKVPTLLSKIGRTGAGG